MITLKQVNKELKDRDIQAELVKGDGYFYFIGEAVKNVKSSSVYVNSINQLTLPQWLDEFFQLN